MEISRDVMRYGEREKGVMGEEGCTHVRGAGQDVRIGGGGMWALDLSAAACRDVCPGVPAACLCFRVLLRDKMIIT